MEAACAGAGKGRNVLLVGQSFGGRCAVHLALGGIENRKLPGNTTSWPEKRPFPAEVKGMISFGCECCCLPSNCNTKAGWAHTGGRQRRRRRRRWWAQIRCTMLSRTARRLCRSCRREPGELLTFFPQPACLLWYISLSHSVWGW